MKKILAIVALLVIAAGCIEPAVKLGCCRKECILEGGHGCKVGADKKLVVCGATDTGCAKGCFLYNTTDFKDYNYAAYTKGTCDKAAASPTEVDTTGLCNVSVEMPSGRKDFLIPICSEDDIVKCIDGNCTAMVCGDFVFKPRVAPGFKDNADDPDAGAEGQAGAVPPDTDKTTVTQFYKAQCRFLPMDAKLRGIMKNSKSQINVFRVGAGGSFDEYDQYRYYLPISDKYCNINQQAAPGEKLVDRYMNYLTADVYGRGAAYDPVSGITENCVDGAGDPAVLAFHETNFKRDVKSPSAEGPAMELYPAVPDADNYRFAQLATMSLFPKLELSGGSLYMSWFWNENGQKADVSKKIDDGYYSRELSIAHASAIYDLEGRGTTRAPFECKYDGNDCYSGTCSTQKYSRSVILQYVGGDNPSNAPEVVADCNAYTDDAGMSKVVCAPTKSVTVQAGAAPKREYGSVVLIPARIEYNADGGFKDAPVMTSDLAEETALDAEWNSAAAGYNAYKMLASAPSGTTYTVTNVTRLKWYVAAKKEDCLTEANPQKVGDGDKVWCPEVRESSGGPPLGGINFFGKMGDNRAVYTGRTVIGWSNLRPGDFTQTLLYKNCGLTADDYTVVELDNATDSDMPDLVASFKRYFQARMMKLKPSFSSGQGVNRYTIVYSSMPWVPTFYKSKRRQIHDDTADAAKRRSYWDNVLDEPIRHFLASPVSNSIKERNVYDESMDFMVDTSGASLLGTGGAFGPNERDDNTKRKWVYTDYSLGISKYVILIHYRDGSGQLGNCAIDDTTYLPRTRTFGWCEPCTTSTLAFQNISAYNLAPAYASSGCKTLKDEFNRNIVVCQKKEMLTPSTAPDRVYAGLEVVPYHFELYAGNNPVVTRAQAAGATPLSYWGMGLGPYLFNVSKGAKQTIINSTRYVYFSYVRKKDCPRDYGTNTDTTMVRCSGVSTSAKLPPVGGAVFFGKTAKTGTSSWGNVQYGGSTIIGYALATPNSFNDLSIVKACQLTENDYVEVELSEPGDANWVALAQAFTPYFRQRMENASKGWYSGCTPASLKFQTYDLLISSMPWVVVYAKGTTQEMPAGSFFPPWTMFVRKSNHLSSTAAQAFRTATPAGTDTEPARGTGACHLSASAITGLPSTSRIYYDLAFSRHVYLFKYTPGSGRLGACKVDEATLLPRESTFCTASYTQTEGWLWWQTTTSVCSAYQELTDAASTDPLNRSVYLPRYQGRMVENAPGSPQSLKELEDLCSSDNTGQMTCTNKYVTDVTEYNGVLTTTGAPRTIPQAMTLKERIGNYLKSGVMPVLDLSNGTNWGKINPKGDLRTAAGTPWFLIDSKTRMYTEYDFERLFGNMGATLVIVEHVKNPADADRKLETIIDRAGIIRDKCISCLTAVHVDTPASNTSFGETVGAVMADPRANLNLDMVTFDYSVTRHPPPATVVGLVNKSKAVAGNIASYGSASLAAGGKPTMVVGFSVDDNDPLWSGNYGILLDNIVQTQGVLVRSGVAGIIYSPVRSAEPGPGVVAVRGDGVGYKKPKFCALQGALEKMASNPPVAVFKRIPTKDVQCVACTSMDYASGACSWTGGVNQQRCSDGALCTLPTGMSAGGAKCPEEVVTAGCPLCTASGRTYECTYTHTNGTVEVKRGNIRNLTSDAYSDVIAGLPEPYRCCLGNETLKYSFSKQSHRTAINKPVVFPKTGDTNIDCGMGGDTLDDLSGLSGFCGYQLPLKMYDIECRVT